MFSFAAVQIERKKKSITHTHVCVSGLSDQSRAEHFRFGPVLDQNKQLNRFFLVFEPNRTENRFKPINFGSVRFGFFPSKPVQTELQCQDAIL